MTAASTVVKTGPRLEQAIAKIDELMQRFEKVELGDAASWTNQSLSFTRATGDMLKIADAILRAGLLREESRGAHYRKDFPERNDERFFKTSVARYNASTGKSDIEFVPVKAVLVELRARTYGKSDSKATTKETAATAS